MASSIDPTFPTTGSATTESVRNNFASAQSEINALLEDAAVGIVEPLATTTAPNGWLVCNGAAVSRTTYADLFGIVGTTFGAGDGSTTFNVPDLRDRFPVGAGGAYAVGDTGGAAAVTLTEAELPSHTHSTAASGSHSHTTSLDGLHTHGGTTDSGGSHSHTGTSNSAGSHNHDVVFATNASSGALQDRMSATLHQISAPSETFTLVSAGVHLHSLSTNTTGSHTHSTDTFSTGNHSHTLTSAGTHTHTVASAGGGEAHENRPPFVGLTFMIRAR